MEMVSFDVSEYLANISTEDFENDETAISLIINNISKALTNAKSVSRDTSLSFTNIDIFESLEAASESYRLMISLKRLFISKIGKNLSPYSCSLVNLYSYFDDNSQGKSVYLDWYCKNGNVDNISVPVDYKNYHVDSVLKRINHFLNRIMTKQYSTVSDSSERRFLRRILSNILEDYKLGIESANMSFVNEICLTFEKDIKFCKNMKSNSESETDNIEFEFINPDIDTLIESDKTFSINLLDVILFSQVGVNSLKLYQTIQEDNLGLIQRLPSKSIISSITNGLSISDEDIDSVKRDNLMSRDLSRCLFGKINFSSKWTVKSEFNGISFCGEQIPAMLSYVDNSLKFSGIKDKGPEMFYYNGVRQLSAMKVVKDEYNNSAVINYNSGNSIIRYFTGEFKGKVSTVFSLYDVNTGNHFVIVSKSTFSKIRKQHGKFYFENKEGSSKIEDIHTILNNKETLNPDFSVNMLKTLDHGNTSVKVENEFTMIKSDMKNGKKTKGTIIKTMKNSSLFNTMLFPGLKIYDFSFIPPNNGKSGILTVVGTVDIGERKLVKMGTVDIPKSKGSYIVNFLQNEYRIGDHQFTKINSISLQGIINSFVLIKYREGDENKQRLIIETYNKTHVINGESKEFEYAIDDIDVSRFNDKFILKSGSISFMYSTENLKRIMDPCTGTLFFA